MFWEEHSSSSTTAAHMNAHARRTFWLHVCGLACFLVAMFIYSPSVTPFQRFDYLGSFVASFAKVVLGTGCMAALLFSVYSFLGSKLLTSIVQILGTTCFCLGSVLFVLFCVAIDSSSFATLAGTSIGVLVGFGCTCQALEWGRVLKQYGPPQCFILVSCAAGISVVLRFLLNMLPETAMLVLYFAVLTAALAIPLFSPEHASSSTSETETYGNASVQSFIEVVNVPALGLVLSAFIMGSMRAVIIEMFNIYLCGALTAALLLLALTIRLRHIQLSLFSYHRAVLLFVVSVLAVVCITYALYGGSALNMLLIFALYSFAALLTLGMLCAIAHAGEFPCDFVFAVAVGLFSLASLLGQFCADVVPEEYSTVIAVVVTALYGIVVVSTTSLGWGSAFGENEARPTSRLGQPQASQQANAEHEIDVCLNLGQKHGLTKRELEILRLLSDGHSGAYISEVLFISPNTARTHIHNIYRKLDVSSREDILRLTK